MRNGRQTLPRGERLRVDAEHDVLIYVTSWCGSCRAALHWLDEQAVAYRTIDIDEDGEGAETVMGLNRGNRSVPTIIVDGEHILTEPSRAQLVEAFGSG
jgi:mycoredoxin